MNPTQFADDHRREINGPRPSPLKINKESHVIHKTSSSSSSSSTSSSLTTKGPSQNQQRHPVIIYTHSPKVIHTQARDFMALVQKLTGVSRSDDPVLAPQANEVGLAASDGSNGRISGHDDATSSSVLTDENCGFGDVQVSSSSVLEAPIPYFSDVPLFTPTASEFFCSPRHFYRYADPVFSPPNMGNPISPSIMEVMKAFPEY